MIRKNDNAWKPECHHWKVIINWQGVILYHILIPQMSRSDVTILGLSLKLWPYRRAGESTQRFKLFIIHQVVCPSFSTHCFPKPFSSFSIKLNEIIPDDLLTCRELPYTKWGHTQKRLQIKIWINKPVRDLTASSSTLHILDYCPFLYYFYLCWLISFFL